MNHASPFPVRGRQARVLRHRSLVAVSRLAVTTAAVLLAGQVTGRSSSTGERLGLSSYGRGPCRGSAVSAADKGAA
jgi:hypothetical protein